MKPLRTALIRLAAGAALASWVLALTILHALAQEGLSAADRGAVATCLAKAKDTPGREACAGRIYRSCIGADEDARPPSDQFACHDRERKVWDDLLNTSYRTLQQKLDPEQKDKLREMQRAWIDSRDKTCSFFWVFFQGTMANPMMANCLNRETARRAVFLATFADDVNGR